MHLIVKTTSNSEVYKKWDITSIPTTNQYYQIETQLYFFPDSIPSI
jgi:hypothetical protein